MKEKVGVLPDSRGKEPGSPPDFLDQGAAQNVAQGRLFGPIGKGRDKDRLQGRVDGASLPGEPVPASSKKDQEGDEKKKNPLLFPPAVPAGPLG